MRFRKHIILIVTYIPSGDLALTSTQQVDACVKDIVEPRLQNNCTETRIKSNSMSSAWIYISMFVLYTISSQSSATIQAMTLKERIIC